MEKEKLLRLEELEKKIKPKERRFIDELEVDGNKAAAALRAGYGKGNGRSAATQASRVLAREDVKEYRALRAVLAYEELGISANSIMCETEKVYRKCMAKEPVLEWNPTTRDWEESGEWKFDSKGALKALELMGEHIGMYKGDKDQTDHEVCVNINVVDKVGKKDEEQKV